MRKRGYTIDEAVKMTVIKYMRKGSNFVASCLFCILPLKTIKLLLYTYMLTGNICNIILNWGKLVFYISPLEKQAKNLIPLCYIDKNPALRRWLFF